ncbi:MAG: hypothetical protein AAF899_01975 [Pseudomonadota bacterium]
MSNPKATKGEAEGTGVAGRPFSEMPGLNDAIAAERDAAAKAETAGAKAADPTTPKTEEKPKTQAAAPSKTAAPSKAATPPKTPSSKEPATTTPAPKTAPATAASSAAAAAAKPATSPARAGAATASTSPVSPSPAPMPPPAKKSGSLAGTVLIVLIALILGGIGTIAAAPQFAPLLPSPVADFLMNRGESTDRTIAALETRIAELQGEVQDLRAAAADAADEQALDSLSQRIGALEDGPATPVDAQALAALGERLAALETAEPDVTGAELATLEERLSELEAAEPEVRESEIAALAERIDALDLSSTDSAALATRLATLEDAPTAATAEALDALSDQLAALTGRLDAAEANAAAAEEAMRAAEAAASRQVQRSQIDAVAGRLTEAFRSGAPYAGALANLGDLTGEMPPEPLSAASDGIATNEDLLEAFPEHAQAAIRADIAANADDGTLGQASAWLRSQVTARPTTAQEGESTEAKLSRIEAALASGNAATALTEAETLDEAPRGALGDWLRKLTDRVAAETALADYLIAVGATPRG